MNAAVLALLLTIGQTYCPDGSCGIGARAGLNIGRIGVGAQVQLGIRPRGEQLASRAMCLINGGLGAHIGGGIILSCGHGSMAQATYGGRSYPVKVLYKNYSGSNGQQNLRDAHGDVAVLQASVPFEKQMHVGAVEPAAGEMVYWQGGRGTVSYYSGPWMWANGRCRMGDSGSPVWNSEGYIVGVISGTNGSEVLICRLNTVREALAAAGITGDKPKLVDPNQPEMQPLPGQAEKDDFDKSMDDLRKRVEEIMRERGIGDEKPAPEQEQQDEVEEPEAREDSGVDESVKEDEQAAEIPQQPEREAEKGGGVVDAIPWASVATWALGAAGVGAGTMGGGWAAWLALLAARRVAKRVTQKKSSEPSTPAPRTKTVVMDETLRDKLIECGEQRSRLEAQVSTLKMRIQELEDEHREHVIAYTDTYKRAVDLANAALHRKDPERWRQFIPAWLAMVDQYHSAVREEKRNAGNSSVYV